MMLGEEPVEQCGAAVTNAWDARGTGVKRTFIEPFIPMNYYHPSLAVFQLCPKYE